MSSKSPNKMISPNKLISPNTNKKTTSVKKDTPKKKETTKLKSGRPGVSEEKLTEYKESFDLFDKDHSGDISAKELSALFKSLGYFVSDKDIKELMKSSDMNTDGIVSFEEFVDLMAKIESQEEPDEEEVLKAFKVFDKDGDGFLSVAEFKHILTSLGDKMTDAEVDEIFKDVDLDGDGQVDFQEFVSFWKVK
jgi:calmodulin